MSFFDKVVIVTGSSSGIGAATALLFSKEKANVVIVGRNESKLKIVKAQCKEVGKTPLVIKADVSNDDEAETIIKQTIDKFGKLDILVNNAGIVQCGNIVDGTLLDTFDAVVNTNLRAVINLTQLATPHLIKTKGNIINISSVVGMRNFKGNMFLGYGLCKAALNFFTEGAATKLTSQFSGSVNVISPGPVVTDIFKNCKIDTNIMKDSELKTMCHRMSSSEEVGNLILYLASDKAAGITGSNFCIDNGFFLLQ